MDSVAGLLPSLVSSVLQNARECVSLSSSARCPRISWRERDCRADTSSLCLAGAARALTATLGARAQTADTQKSGGRCGLPPLLTRHCNSPPTHNTNKKNAVGAARARRLLGDVVRALQARRAAHELGRKGVCVSRSRAPRARAAAAAAATLALPPLNTEQHHH